MKESGRETQGLQKSEIKGMIEMFIQPSNSPARLLTFMLQLEKTCNSDNHSAGIISRGGSFDQGAFIAISPGSKSPEDLINKISNMPEVEKVEEEPPANAVSSRLSTLFTHTHLLNHTPKKRFRIVLKETKKEMPKIGTF